MLILKEVISYRTRNFINNITINGPKNIYNNEEVELGLRKFVVKYV